METKQVSREEVKRAFLLANAGKKIFSDNLNPTEEEFYDSYRKIKQELESINAGEVDYRIGSRHMVRLVRYNSLEWFRGIKSFENMGSWHDMGGLDFKLTNGNILDTAKNFGTFREKTKNRIISISKYINLIRENFPPVIIPGGLERELWYNQTIRSLDQKPHEIYEFDVDDGNLRCVALALSGFKETEVYFGKYDGPLEELHQLEENS